MQTLLLLGFPEVLDILSRFVQCPLGQREVAGLRPLEDRPRIEERLDCVQECRRYLQEEGCFSFRHLLDPEPVLANLAIEGQVLDPEEVLALLRLLEMGRDLKRTFTPRRWPCLSARLKELPVLEQPIREIERTIDPSAQVRESADPELGQVRRRQAHFHERAQEKLRSYFTGPRAKYLIEEPFITTRNGRYVLPVRVEHRGEIPGVVHAASSSGATLFLEPFTVVELNNQYVYYRELEQEIIRRILRRVSEHLRRHHHELMQTAAKVGELDLCFACAAFAGRYRCVRPCLNGQRSLRLSEARHPLLLESLGEERVVPISLHMSAQQNALVISGPNTGGKTVALKTVGLISLMAQSGIPVPAAEADLPVFSQVLADIGDHQSISEQLSTFSAHVLTLKEMIETLRPPSLILLDEIGRGTDPVHGSALGIAALDFFRAQETLVVATTHHQAIKSFAFSTAGIESAGVELDAHTLRPTYRLKFGVAGSSSGLEIASQLGLPEGLIRQARSSLSQQDTRLQQYLDGLREEMESLEKEKEALRLQIEQLQHKEKELEFRFQEAEKGRQQALEEKMVQWEAQFQRETEQFVQTLKDRLQLERLRKEAGRKQAALKEAFRRKVTPGTGTPAAGLREGDQVYAPFFRKKGMVVAVKDGEATLEMEGKRVTAPLHQLEKADEAKTSAALPQNVSLHVVEEEVEPELNLIGSRVDEALMQVDKFLDRAFLSHLREVRIIHGFGTGRLRVALSDFLGTHPHVSEHRVEGGATLVWIKE